MEFVDSIYHGDLLGAKEHLRDKIEEILSKKLDVIVDKITEEIGLTEDNIQRMGRTKLYRARIRKGKIQRRVKKSAVSGFIYRGGRLVRMSPMEKRHRKLAAKRSKFKRRAKLNQTIRKRAIAIRKRKALGIQ